MSKPTDLDEIVARLQAAPLAVARRYAPGGTIANGHYTVRCPWRADRKAGSFIITINGAYAGRWHDYASGEHGDMLDLIERVTGGDKKAAIQEAMSYLGITQETPEQRAAALRRAAEAQERMVAEENPEASADARSVNAHRLFQHCQTDILGTPVEHYLSERGIRLREMDRVPSVIRFHPSLKYLDTDPETGAFTERHFPAMVTAIHGPANVFPPVFWGVHRTYLAKDEEGRWKKAPVRAPKKIMGQVKGGFVRLCGNIGPEGAVFLTEGIEDGLSAATLDPTLCVVVACTLGNLGMVVLPKSVKDVTIAADNDEGVGPQKALEKALAFHGKKKRLVRVWRNEWGGKDLNDALIQFQQEARA